MKCNTRFLCIAITGVIALSCYDDSALWEIVNDHEERITELEIYCNELNRDINSLHILLDAVATGNYIVDVQPLLESGTEVGYTITFAHSNAINIYHGKDGADSQTPLIGVKQDEDSIYYWTLNGDWLLDENGTKIPATAEGKDENDEVSSIIPQLKIEDNMWLISYDNGESWTNLGITVTDPNYKPIFSKVDFDDSFIYFTLADGSVITAIREEFYIIDPPCMINPPINFFKENLKVLDIGNSYTQDAHRYLENIALATGANIDCHVYKAIRGSGSYKSWVDCYKDKDPVTYNISRTLGISIDNIAGTGVANDGFIFRNALSAVQWDIILIHQVSNYANDYNLWDTNCEGGYLKELIYILRKTNPQATIGFLLIHSYRSTYSANTEKSSFVRWKNIADATKQLKRNYGIDFIIPYGTAVQNLRASSLNDEYEFSTDGTHLADGLGDYVASCCYYQSLLAPRFGISVLGNSWRKDNLDENQAGVLNVTDETALVAQKAAILATYNMWGIMNPDKYEL